VLKTLKSDFTCEKIFEMTTTRIEELLAKRSLTCELAENKTNGYIAIHKKNCNATIMLGEEDHMRIQVIQQGLDLISPYNQAKKIADQIESKHKLAYDESLGYLTECLSNIGLGIRASVMLALPKLHASGRMELFINQLRDLHIDVRGSAGEFDDGSDGVFQISNDISMFRDEQRTIETITRVAIMLAQYEREEV